MGINFRIIFRILGLLLLIEGLCIALCLSASFMYNEEYLPLILSSSVTIIIGVLLYFLSAPRSYSLMKREGYLIVTLGWIFFSLFGALPFILSGHLSCYTDAFFETISGFTTTGASVINNIEALPAYLLLWRSFTQWLGGMGIIVLSLAILPMLGIGGMQLFIAEVPGPTADKIHPRVKETAKRLWVIYFIFTFVETVLLKLGGMSWFDAINHSFTTMATGGYSTKQESIAYYNSPYIHYIITLFMFIAGANFAVSYFAMHFQFKKVFCNEEFMYYLYIVLFFVVILSLALFCRGYCVEEAFRLAAFQVVSIITTTGFATDNYLLWGPLAVTVMFLLMFIGSSAGSTGGGIKVVRVLVFIKNAFLELKRILHPNALVPVRLNDKTLAPDILIDIIVFISFYLLMVVIGVLVMSSLGLDLETSLGSVTATLGNIGPGIGNVGPADNFAFIPAAGKWFLSFLMLVGRLELFTVLIILFPAFWRN